ncbi:MAG TPA: type VII secretion protein EccB [Marmoricola sp.]|nr:type VII secretion protein EccB [Marmoricola sp.]
MSSKRDLVEAHSFNRRRLVTAFVSGAPGGREMEPTRYGRALVGGLVLAAMVVAGAAVSGFLKPTVPSGWLDGDLVIGKSSGSRFVAYKGTLYPVINATSARLILATDGTMKVDFVPDDKIAAQHQGAPIGIPGAPDTLPAPGRLIATGWTACTNAGQGIKVRVAQRPAATPAPRAAFLVSADGEDFVVAGQHRYPVPTGADRAATLRALGLDGEAPRTVPGQWLDLFALGSPLGPFRVPGQGRHVGTAVRGLDTVGTPVQVNGRPYVLGTRGHLLRLTDFAWTMYRSAGPGAVDPVQLSAGEATRLATAAGDRPYPEDWPEQDVSAYSSPTEPCALLTRGQAPGGTLAVPRGTQATTSGSGIVRAVQAGHGALVRATTANVLDVGQVYLLDASGTSYAVGNKGGEQPAKVALGYADVTPVPVPQAWVDLFADGPQLDYGQIQQVVGSDQ